MIIYEREGGLCDLFTYHVTMHSGDRTNTVRTIGAALNAPSELERIIVLIQRLMYGAKQ